MKSSLKEVLNQGRFAVTAELGPPRGSDQNVVREKANFLKDADAINVTDCQTAITRMSSVASCFILKQMGLNPVLQMTCRDRNRIAIQSDLLGAAALGIENVLLMTGDHQKFGDHPEAKGVFDLDSISLIAMVKKMRDEKKFLSGDELNPAPNFFIGAVENPFASPVEFRAKRLGKKIRAGAEFFQTQIVYNLERFEAFMAEVNRLGFSKEAYILAGVCPLKSAGMAKYMRSKVPGLDVPDHIISRMQEAAEPKKEGIEICVEIIKRIREIKGVAGVHIMAVEWEEVVPEILEKAGLKNT